MDYDISSHAIVKFSNSNFKGLNKAQTLKFSNSGVEKYRNPLSAEEDSICI